MENICEKISKLALALFSWGLLLSHRVVEYACVDMLISFYANTPEREKHLAKSAVLVSLQEGLASMTAVILAFFTNQRVRRRFFMALIISTSAYIAGLTILWSYERRQSQAMNFPLFLLAAFLIALGKGGCDPLLQSFHSYGLISENDLFNRRIEAYNSVWLQSAWISGAAIAVFALLGAGWEKVFKISIILMASSTASFLVSFCFVWYRSQNHGGDSSVQEAETSNPESVAHDGNSNCQLLPNESNLESSKEVRMVYFLMATCIGYILVMNTGNTFFQEQGTKMEQLQINKEKVRFSLFLVIKTFVSELTILIFWLAGVNEKQQVMLGRISAGMVCAVTCCVVAWKVEVQRQGHKPMTMSVLWLCPHYVLLGLVEGLAHSGLEKFLENYQHDSLKNLRRPIRDLVSCIGKFLNIPLILIVSDWFKNFQLDRQSHLERYYLMLAVLSSVFLCIYLCLVLAGRNCAKRTKQRSARVGNDSRVDE